VLQAIRAFLPLCLFAIGHPCDGENTLTKVREASNDRALQRKLTSPACWISKKFYRVCESKSYRKNSMKDARMMQIVLC